MSRIDELGRQDQEIGPNRLQCGVQILAGQTKSLEPMDEIVRQQENLEEGDVGDPVVGGNFAKGGVVEELSDILLDGGAFGIKTPRLAKARLSDW